MIIIGRMLVALLCIGSMLMAMELSKEQIQQRIAANGGLSQSPVISVDPFSDALQGLYGSLITAQNEQQLKAKIDSVFPHLAQPLKTALIARAQAELAELVQEEAKLRLEIEAENKRAEQAEEASVQLRATKLKYATSLEALRAAQSPHELELRQLREQQQKREADEAFRHAENARLLKEYEERIEKQRQEFEQRLQAAEERAQKEQKEKEQARKKLRKEREEAQKSKEEHDQEVTRLHNENRGNKAAITRIQGERDRAVKEKADAEQTVRALTEKKLTAKGKEKDEKKAPGSKRKQNSDESSDE